jgi:hypothetical protein
MRFQFAEGRRPAAQGQALDVRTGSESGPYLCGSRGQVKWPRPGSIMAHSTKPVLGGWSCPKERTRQEQRTKRMEPRLGSAPGQSAGTCRRGSAHRSKRADSVADSLTEFCNTFPSESGHRSTPSSRQLCADFVAKVGAFSRWVFAAAS